MAFRTRAPKNDLRDLGFGRVVANATGHRMINRDGSFSVRRERLGWRGTLSLYHRLITMRWSTYLVVLLLVFLAINAVFATAYFLLGAHTVAGDATVASSGPWWTAFFLSVHTATGVGYGNVVPNGFAANLLMTLESFVGLVFFALTTGVVFARFSRPQAAITFSRQAIVAPYRNGAGFMFRLANGRKNELINMEVTVLLSLLDEDAGVMQRSFVPLALERSRVALFPLSWTIVHPIDEQSPLAGLTHEDLHRRDAEVLVMVEGVEDTFSQPVYTRTSYKAHEVLWGAKFASVFRQPEPGSPLAVDVAGIHRVEPAEVPV